MYTHEYKGSDPLLQKFYEIQKTLKLQDFEMNELLEEPVGEQTYHMWKREHSSPNGSNRIQIEKIVSNFNPERPKDILLLKNREKFRKRCQKQKEITELVTKDPDSRKKQILKNGNINEDTSLPWYKRNARANEMHSVEKKLIELGKEVANHFDLLEVENIREKFIPLNGNEQLEYYKRLIEKNNESLITKEVNDNIKKAVQDRTNYLEVTYDNHVEYIHNTLEEERHKNEYLYTLLEMKIEEIHFLENQVKSIKAQVYYSDKLLVLENKEVLIELEITNDNTKKVNKQKYWPWVKGSILNLFSPLKNKFKNLT